jgi:hypothetical protein
MAPEFDGEGWCEQMWSRSRGQERLEGGKDGTVPPARARRVARQSITPATNQGRSPGGSRRTRCRGRSDGARRALRRDQRPRLWPCLTNFARSVCGGGRHHRRLRSGVSAGVELRCQPRDPFGVAPCLDPQPRHRSPASGGPKAGTRGVT